MAIGPKKDLKTTIGGVVAGLAIVFTQVGYALDSDPATTMSITAIVGALGLVWALFSAQDHA